MAIAGVGNCTSALVQGCRYYEDADEENPVQGLMHVNFGDYTPKDIRFTAAFDVNTLKIGRDLGEAIFMEPNCCARFAEVGRLGVKVMPGPMLDGVAYHMKKAFKTQKDEEYTPVDVASVLRETRSEILVNFLPVGSYNATRYYAEAALKAGCAFINCIPEFIVSDSTWAERFREAGLPIAGDDIKSQVGATILHRSLVNLLKDRGVKVNRTYQLNLGGNTDFLNMTVEERLTAKRESKTKAVTSLLNYDVPTRIGPSDYVPFLKDKKVCYIHLEGSKFGEQPLSIDLKLTVEDSPNSAGVVMDVIRATKIALDRGISGPLLSISSYCFKHPPVNVPDDVAKIWVEEFISGKRER